MAGMLKTHLDLLSQSDPFAKALAAHWNMDHTLLCEALTHISKVFTHFSRHDTSHAENILNGIERFLGADAISKLSATDAWLILESAYWHDIGMLIAHDEFVTLYDTPEFKIFIEEIKAVQNHELQRIAQSISQKSSAFFDIDKNLPIKIDQFIQLIALFLRKKHAKRSEDILKEPERYGIRTPRTGLLPDRIIQTLGTICAMHTAPFSTVMDSLHQCENGLGTDICHPRFIACLLRIGDLLDLDNGRFSPILSALAPPSPASQLAHEDKHSAIKHFLVTPEKIEVKAICQSYPGYTATAQWFKWLENEVMAVTKDWLGIVPAGWNRTPPRIGELSVSLGAGQEVVSDGIIPKVDIDIDAALEMFQGVGLYKNKWQAIRELLQNAVDASLIKLWIDNKDELSINSDKYFPGSTDFDKLAERYAISINIKPLQKTETHLRWEVTIRDSGIGISNDDFYCMLKVGASSNKDRRRIIEDMPEWLRPSGAFGLGLQSAFAMGTTELNFHTHSKLSGEAHHYRMPSPVGGQQGFCSIQKAETNPYESYGTALVFEMEGPLVPNSVPVDNDFYNTGESFGFSSFDEFDPILDKELSVDLVHVIYQSVVFSRTSLIPVLIQTPYNKEVIRNSNKESKIEPYYDKDHRILISNIGFSTQGHRQNVYYRGQLVDKSWLSFHFITFDVDIFSNNSKEVLHISRNEMRDGYRYDLPDKVINIVKDAIFKNIDQVDKDELSACSLFLRFYFEEEKQPEKIRDKWRNIAICGDLKMKDLMAYSKIELSIPVDGRNVQTNYTKNKIDKSIHITWTKGSNAVPEFISEELQAKENNFFCSLAEDQEKYHLHFIFQKTKTDPIPDALLRKTLSPTNNKYGFFHGGRLWIPAPDKYKKLIVTWDTGMFITSPFYKYKGGKFILPFFFNKKKKIITTQGLDELCAFTLVHSKAKKLTLDEVRNLYIEYISWADKVLMKDDTSWQEARIDVFPVGV